MIPFPRRLQDEHHPIIGLNPNLPISNIQF